MSVVLLRAVYGAFIMGCMAQIYLIFARAFAYKKYRRPKEIVLSIVAVPFWPLFMGTAKGRAFIWKKLDARR